jgi:phosphorylcholine metabolism protein LicD|tara:strand:+ start:850 stop:1161 length:312 start_codon:yes stop_codon:yes gene_type:complete
MGRLTKLKKENIKKANEILDSGHKQKYPAPKTTPLKPSANVTNNSKSFVNKMNGLTESVINEAPKKDTYWMITKANRDNLIKMGGTAEEIGKSATDNFQKYCK